MSSVKITIPKDYAELMKKILENHESSDVRDLRRIGDMVEMLGKKIRRLWDENHDQDAICKCNHPYHRHFDGYDDMRAVGCKYCECDTFEGK